MSTTDKEEVSEIIGNEEEGVKVVIGVMMYTRIIISTSRMTKVSKKSGSRLQILFSVIFSPRQNFNWCENL